MPPARMTPSGSAVCAGALGGTGRAPPPERTVVPPTVRVVPPRRAALGAAEARPAPAPDVAPALGREQGNRSKGGGPRAAEDRRSSMRRRTASPRSGGIRAGERPSAWSTRWVRQINAGLSAGQRCPDLVDRRQPPRLAGGRRSPRHAPYGCRPDYPDRSRFGCAASGRGHRPCGSRRRSRNPRRVRATGRE
jgi:hypothetical protein